MDLTEVRPMKTGRADRLLKTIAPGFWARREEARLRGRRLELASSIWADFERDMRRDGFKFKGYQGATTKRGYSQWNPGGGSADEDILDDLEKLRDRSRDLIRNDPHAAGLVETWVSNIVGSGLRPQCRINAKDLGLKDEAADTFRRAAERLFDRFWTRADAAGLLTFGEIQQLCIRKVFEDGDVAIIPRPDPEAIPGLRLQVIEADRIRTPPGKLANLYIRDGVVIDDMGRHVSYWVKKTHPGDVIGKLRADDYINIPARTDGVQQIYHLFRVRRPEQSRGTPELAPAMLLFRDLQQYFKAELTAAKVAACFSIFIHTADPLGLAAASSQVNTDGKQEEQIEPGMMRYLSPGQDITSANPGRPNSEFNAFTMRILRAIGSCVGAPYEVVSNDFSQTTYTSGRMALNEVRRTYCGWKNWLIEKFCQPIYERLIEEAVLEGELIAPKFDELKDLYCATRWVGPGWTWVDPAKEVSATVESLKNNLSTLADEAAARGLDWEELLEQRAREETKRKELGLESATPAPAPPPGSPGAKPDQDQEEGADQGDQPPPKEKKPNAKPK